jgi:hypothetical protein
MEQMKAQFTCSYYDSDADMVHAHLIRIGDLHNVVFPDRNSDQRLAAVG